MRSALRSDSPPSTKYQFPDCYLLLLTQAALLVGVNRSVYRAASPQTVEVPFFSVCGDVSLLRKKTDSSVSWSRLNRMKLNYFGFVLCVCVTPPIKKKKKKILTLNSCPSLIGLFKSAVLLWVYLMGSKYCSLILTELTCYMSVIPGVLWNCILLLQPIKSVVS